MYVSLKLLTPHMLQGRQFMHSPTLFDRFVRGAGWVSEGRGLCCRSNLVTLDISAASSKDLVTGGRVGSGRSGGDILQEPELQNFCRVQKNFPKYFCRVQKFIQKFLWMALKKLHIRTSSSVEEYIDTLRISFRWGALKREKLKGKPL